MYKDKDFLHRHFVENEASPRYIAKKIGCSISAVNNALKSMGLEDIYLSRSRKDIDSLGNAPYGKKKIKGVLVDHLGEKRVIRRMLELRKDGLSYRKIADYLNKINVPTKHKGATWQQSSVRRIIIRNDIGNN